MGSTGLGPICYWCHSTYVQQEDIKNQLRASLNYWNETSDIKTLTGCSELLLWATLSSSIDTQVVQVIFTWVINLHFLNTLIQRNITKREGEGKKRQKIYMDNITNLRTTSPTRILRTLKKRKKKTVFKQIQFLLIIASKKQQKLSRCNKEILDLQCYLTSHNMYLSMHFSLV